MTDSQARKPPVHVAMLGARMHYAVPLLFARAGQLGTFYTDIYLGNKPVLCRLLVAASSVSDRPSFQRLLGKACLGIPREKVVSFDGMGVRTRWLLRRARTTADVDRVHASTNREFCERVVARGLRGAGAIYGFNGASLEIFRAARQNGAFCFLEQTIAPKRVENQLLKEEGERWSGWEPGLGFAADNGPLDAREEAEWKLANCLLCPSDFVARGLQECGVSPSKTVTVPYGVEVPSTNGARDRTRDGPVRVLFAGQVCLRKGVPYLLRALSMLGSSRIQCRLVGELVLDRRRLAEFGRWVEIVGPAPRSRMPEFFRWADVLVFPSLCEGSATVTYEAIASGVPVITTDNAGSVVRDGVEGFIVPIRDAGAVARRLEQLATDRSLLADMSQAALQRSREFTLERYGGRLLQVIGPYLSPQLSAAGRTSPSQYS